MYVETIDDLLELGRKPSMGGVYSIFYPIYEESVYLATMCFMQFQHMNFLHHRIKIQQPPSSFYLQPSSTSRQSQITRSQIHISQETFFYMKGQKKVPSRQLPLLLRPTPSRHVDCYNQSAVDFVTSTTRFLEHVPVLRPVPSRRLQLKRERERGKKSIYFLC